MVSKHNRATWAELVTTLSSFHIPWREDWIERILSQICSHHVSHSRHALYSSPWQPTHFPYRQFINIARSENVGENQMCFYEIRSRGQRSFDSPLALSCAGISSLEFEPVIQRMSFGTCEGHVGCVPYSKALNSIVATSSFCVQKGR
ncbi:hypothetical protein RRG08_030032 [Elysia crispata]|uniref:Uncharacterized protein n=1 Tax=Elysia crispata TaxID=231223 RepID=A0AAE0XY74_9GAST|nr:hypothetical protein RRG08_030032 [Elysia crispata]